MREFGIGETVGLGTETLECAIKIVKFPDNIYNNMHLLVKVFLSQLNNKSKYLN